jgi:DNA-directed RNA polymerase subunit RPC12/RpoP
VPSYRIPKDEQVLAALRRATDLKPIVDSQRKLKRIVDREMRGEEGFKVGEERLRRLAIDSKLFDLRIQTRETELRKSLITCPVCGSRLGRLRNATVFGGTVTLGYRCRTCGYWTGLRRRVPVRYTFTRK